MGELDHQAVGRPKARAGAAWESETPAGWPGAGPVRPRPGADLTSAARVNKIREVRRPTSPWSRASAPQWSASWPARASRPLAPKLCPGPRPLLAQVGAQSVPALTHPTAATFLAAQEHLAASTFNRRYAALR